MPITWDEEMLAEQERDRGVVYGTQKIDHPDTPFLYYDEEAFPAVQEAVGAGKKVVIDAADLQKRLGLLHSQEERFQQPKYDLAADSSEAFFEKRNDFYSGEAEVAAASVGLPAGWTALMARSLPKAIFYHHAESDTTQWERPTFSDQDVNG